MNQSTGHLCGDPEIDSLIYERISGCAIQELCVDVTASQSQNLVARDGVLSSFTLIVIRGR
jgi:hypothetical protein